MIEQKGALDELNFSENSRVLDLLVRDLLCFQSYTSVIVLEGALPNHRRKTRELYNRVRKIAQRYSEAEMPGMHRIVKVLERDYPYLKH